MTISVFCKIINEHTRVRVLDRYGFAGEYTVNELEKEFNAYTPIIELKAYDYDIIFIVIDRL